MKNLKWLSFPILLLLFSCSKEDDGVPTCEDCNFTCVAEFEADVLTNDCMDNLRV